MREAVGGTLLIKIVIVFLFIYIVFMSVILAYGRVFRTKNKIINYIEQNEGISNYQGFQEVVSKRFNYNGKMDICYEKVGDRGYYYKTTVYITFQLPLVKDILRVPVSGETRLIDTGNIYNEEATIDSKIDQCS